MSVTSLTIYLCDISKLCQLLKYTPILNYLKMNHLYGSGSQIVQNDELNLINTNAFNLKELVRDDSNANFKSLELLLKLLTNLKIFSISAEDQIELINANRWQHLIESSLPQLNIFKFNFDYSFNCPYNEMLKKIRQFQTNFWHEQHQWYTNYEILDFTVSIYTIPYIVTINE